MSFLKLFDKEYATKLGKRAHTFRKVFETLENRRKAFYNIIETGCIRSRDNFSGDGMSTLLFDKFVNYYEGRVLSIDITKKHCKIADELTSDRTTVVCSDSVKYLWGIIGNNYIDLLYLDSYDIDFSKPHKSALHHMKELCAISGVLTDGTLVVVDDHRDEGSGKGMYVADFMENLGYKRFINDYQIGWIVGF